MADEKKDETKTREKIKQLDFQKVAIFIIMRQTPTRNIYEVIEGQERAKVEEYAKAEAKRLNSTVVVFGPQIAAFAPPPPPEPQAIGFDFSQ